MNTGPFDRPQHTLNIQPVVPFHLSPDWKLITRTIVPVLSNPDPGLPSGRDGGIGDITLQGFLSPVKHGELTWGAGIALSLPTASKSTLGGRLRAKRQLEIFYNFRVTPWLRLTGDIQTIRPSRRSVDTTVVPGVRRDMIL